MAFVTASSAGCSLFQDLPLEDLGNTGGSSGLPSPPEEEGDGSIDPGFVGHWVGYAEDPFRTASDGRPAIYTFPSGSTDITLDFSFEQEAFPVASLVFGTGTPPPPEAGVSYPPGFDHYRSTFNYPFQAPPVEGFAYHLTETVLRFEDPGKAAILTYSQFEALADWCPLQPALPAGNGDYFECSGGGGFSGGDPALGIPCRVDRLDGTEEDVDCNYVALCASEVCRCSEEGCVFNNDRASQAWLEVNGDEITGTFSSTVLDVGQPGRYVPIGPVHFHRVAAE